MEEEFSGFLRCGWFAGEFARFRCTRCRTERLAAFSYKGRGFCSGGALNLNVHLDALVLDGVFAAGGEDGSRRPRVFEPEILHARSGEGSPRG